MANRMDSDSPFGSNTAGLANHTGTGGRGRALGATNWKGPTSRPCVATEHTGAPTS
jgi:hypothetical protein